MTRTIYWLSVSLLVATFSQAAAASPEIRRLVAAEAARNGVVPTSLALAVARVESNFDAGALSSAGARGVMQIMPRTAREEYGVPADALWEPRTNVRLGLRYLASLYRLYGRRWDLALSHYNGGTLSRSRSGRARIHSYTRRYVERVLAFERRYRDALPHLLRELKLDSAPRPVAARAEGSPGWKEYLSAADFWLATHEEAKKVATAEVRSRPRKSHRSLALKRRFDTTAERFRAGLGGDF